MVTLFSVSCWLVCVTSMKLIITNLFFSLSLHNLHRVYLFHINTTAKLCTYIGTRGDPDHQQPPKRTWQPEKGCVLHATQQQETRGCIECLRT